ncbi:MAG TPA: hypothetical protein VKB78_05525 [Pirellulales bacterium]|nr:hypothetical protein [Pirellulales bacterium]
MTVLFLTTDLMFTSRLSGVASRLGMTLKIAATSAALIKLLAADPGSLVLVDLNSPGLDPRSLVADLKALSTPPQAIVAFGPHVHENRLAEATAAGCDEVLTRGQFNAHMEETLAKWQG